MLGWSMNLFRVRGIQLAVHFSFFLLLAYAAVEGFLPAPAEGGGWMGAFWGVTILLSFFTCVVLHELGHSFTAMHFGVGVRRILLMPIGGMAEFDSIPRQPARELLITLAGPAVNFAIALVLWAAVGVPDGWPFGPNGFPHSLHELMETLLGWSFPSTASGFAQLMLHLNVLMGCFNLVPVFPMDGGRILRAVLATRLPYLRATWIAASIGKVLAVVAASLALFFFRAPLTAALFTFIIFAGEVEYRAARRRELEDAQWREVLARFHGQSRSVDEPPLLTH
jgi:Zn-dependent protease